MLFPLTIVPYVEICWLSDFHSMGNNQIPLEIVPYSEFSLKSEPFTIYSTLNILQIILSLVKYHCPILGSITPWLHYKKQTLKWFLGFFSLTIIFYTDIKFIFLNNTTVHASCHWTWKNWAGSQLNAFHLLTNIIVLGGTIQTGKVTINLTLLRTQWATAEACL